MRTPYRALALFASAFALCGCLPGPSAPNSASTDAYRWRAPLDGAASEPVHRFDLTPEWQQWMDANAIRAIAVFDALGHAQMCGLLGHGHAELSNTQTTFEGRTTPYDPAECKADGELPVCFEGQPCELPVYCPRIRIYLDPASLGSVTTLDQLVAIANQPAPPPACEKSSDVNCTPARIPANETISRARYAARTALVHAGLDRKVAPDPPRRERRKWFNPGETTTTLNKDGLFVIPAAPVLPDRDAVAHNTMLQRYDSSGGYVVTFNEPAAEFEFLWRQPDATRVTGKVVMIAYDTDGRPLGPALPLYPTTESPPGTLRQIIRNNVPLRTFRVVTEANVPDLQLVAVHATTYAQKPFIDAGKRQYWFAARGTAPYSIYADRGHGACADAELTEASARDPRLLEPDRPLPLAVGERSENPRSVLAAFAADQYDAFVWLCWLAGLLVIWIPAAVVIAMRWIDIERRVAARQRRP